MNIFSALNFHKYFSKFIGVSLLLISSLSEAAIFTVTQANDNGGGGAGTLSAAINQVNLSADLINTINFSPIIGGNVVTVTGNLPNITNVNTVNIDGSGVPGLIIRGNIGPGIPEPMFQLDGNNSRVNFSSLTIDNAFNQGANNAPNGNGAFGGAVGTAPLPTVVNLTLTDVVLTNNRATGGNANAPGPGNVGRGGGVHVTNGSSLSIINANVSTATNGNAVAGGNGIGGGAVGAAEGSDIYLDVGVNAIFNQAAGLTQTLAGTIGGGGGSITKQGPGTLILNGVNTYGGGTTISQGTLRAADAANLPGNVTNNAALIFDIQANRNFAHVVSGSGNVTVLGIAGRTLTYTNNNTYTGGASISGVALELGIANALPIGGAVSFGDQNASLMLNNFNQTIGDLSGDGGISLGTGTLTLGTANSTTYAGNIQGANPASPSCSYQTRNRGFDVNNATHFSWCDKN